jgi:hypothetical protein
MIDLLFHFLSQFFLTCSDAKNQAFVAASRCFLLLLLLLLLLLSLSLSCKNGDSTM